MKTDFLFYMEGAGLNREVTILADTENEAHAIVVGSLDAFDFEPDTLASVECIDQDQRADYYERKQTYERYGIPWRG